MRNKKVNYRRVQIGDMLLLVPLDRGESNVFDMNHDILWSLKEFDYKVFGYLHIEPLLYNIIQERAKAGLPFYDIELDMYNPESYPGTMESSFKNSWNYAVMRQTYRYFDQLVSRFPDFPTTAFAVSCGWNNNTQDALQIYPLDGKYQNPDYNTKLAIQFSSYTIYTEHYLEGLIVQIGKCKKLKKNYKNFIPTEEKEEPIIVGKHLIEKYNAFFLFRKGRIYCGLKYKNSNILYEVNWNLFGQEMISPKGCYDCNPGYKMKICMPEDGLKIFTHHLIKAYGLGGNDIHSVSTQIINLIDSQWKRLQKEHPKMKKVIFKRGYDEKQERGKRDYIIIQYVNKNWGGPTKEIHYTYDGDYIVQEQENISKAL